MSDIKQIQEQLSSLGYKIDFWYQGGKLDAICVAKWEGEDLKLQQTYKINDIATILFNHFIEEERKNIDKRLKDMYEQGRFDERIEKNELITNTK